MAWVRIDDEFPQHPKIAKVGPLGMALQVAGLCYCNRYLTDGFIPWAIGQNLLVWEFLDSADAEGQQKRYKIGLTSGMTGEDVRSDFIIALLVEAGIWEIVENGYRIHDYAVYQPTKAEVLALQLTRTEAGRRGGKAKSSKTLANNVANSVANAKQMLEQNASKTLPQSQSQSQSRTPTPTPTQDPSTHVEGVQGEIPLATPARLTARPREIDTKKKTLAKDGTDTETKSLSHLKAPKVVSETFRAAQILKYPIQGEEWVLENIADALAHKAVNKWQDTDRYVGNWLRRAAHESSSPPMKFSGNGHLAGKDYTDPGYRALQMKEAEEYERRR